MLVQNALEIANREWENIRISLKECGDIGVFNDESQSYNNGNGSSQIDKDSSLVTSLIQMDSKLPEYGYFTMDAAHVFATLASKAGAALGLCENLASKFGCGYSLVRTSCLDRKCGNDIQRHVLKQLLFFKIFFPLGGIFDWDFDSPAEQLKLKLVFHMFKDWQSKPESYKRDLTDFGEQVEPLLRGLSIKVNLPEIVSSGNSNGGDYIENEQKSEMEYWIEHWD
jgi:hypothetical protein